MNTDKREQLIEAYYNAVDEENYEAFEHLFTADARHIRPGQGVLEGDAAVLTYYENHREATNTTHDVKRQVHDDMLTLCLVEVSGEAPDGPFSRLIIGEFVFDATTDRISGYQVYRGYAGETDVTPE